MTEDDESPDLEAAEAGTFVASDHTAVIVAPDGALRILVPGDDDTDLPREALALVAVAVRLTKDPAYCDEVIGWIDDGDGEEEGEEPG